MVIVFFLLYSWLFSQPAGYVNMRMCMGVHISCQNIWVMNPLCYQSQKEKKRSANVHPAHTYRHTCVLTKANCTKPQLSYRLSDSYSGTSLSMQMVSFHCEEQTGHVASYKQKQLRMYLGKYFALHWEIFCPSTNDL